jgi:uncharacterized Tic20 family protein
VVQWRCQHDHHEETRPGTSSTHDDRSATAAPLSEGEQRTVGVIVHAVPAAALVLSAGTLGFVASLVIYLVYKDRGEYARRQAANSLNIQIVTGILLLLSLPLMLVLVGFLTYGIVIVWATVLHVLGAVRASNGQWWNPPLTPRFVR